MLVSMLAPLVCLVVPGGDGWSEAQAAFHRERQPGYASCLVYLERLDASSLRIRVLGAGARMGLVEGDFPGFATHAFRVRVPRGSSDLRAVTAVPDGGGLLRLKLQGEAFSPEVTLRVPRPGEAEGVVLQAELGPAGGSGSK